MSNKEKPNETPDAEREPARVRLTSDGRDGGPKLDQSDYGGPTYDVYWIPGLVIKDAEGRTIRFADGRPYLAGDLPPVLDPERARC